VPVGPPGRADLHLFPSASAFRAWLEAHHDDASHLWVAYYKKGVPKAAMTYVQAVEEALCFGWIDGITYRVDDESTATRFTPRRSGSGWSATNIARVAELTAAGRMRPAGLRAFEERDRRRDAVYGSERPTRELPPAYRERFRAHPAAWAYWEAQPPSYRRTVSHWVLDAKREETRLRRLEVLIADSAAGTWIKPMSYGRNR
jgi:uncharacterized protein YdeI (YjbR/CyaY-like superfamily)